MTYIKLDDRFHTHPKVVRLSDAAYRLYIGMLCYASANETDGLIPEPALCNILPRGWRKALTEIAAVGLADERETAWEIHDYLKHQRSKEEITRLRDAAKIRAKSARSSRELPEPEDRGQLHRQSVTHLPVLPPRATGNPSEGSPAIDWFRYVCGREPRTGAELQVVNDLDVHGSACVAWGFQLAIGKQEPERYAKRVFDSCIQEGHGPRQRGSNGASGQRIRAGAGRGGGRAPNLIDKWDAYLADHPDTGLPAAIDGVGSAAGDVAGDV